MGVWGMNAGIRNTLLGCFAFMALMLGLFTNNMFREPVLSDAELREKALCCCLNPGRWRPSPWWGMTASPLRRQALPGAGPSPISVLPLP